MFINVVETCAELIFFIGHVVSMYRGLFVVKYMVSNEQSAHRLFRCYYYMYAWALEIR